MARTRGNAESAADIDGWIRSALEPLEPGADAYDDAVPTTPPSPQSDIRRIGSTMSDPDEDPLALYVEALSPRVRRETVALATRPRQMTLLMDDRPRANARSSPLALATPPMTIVPVARRAQAAEPAPPGPFRGAIPLVLLAFGMGIFLSGVVVFVLARL
jgi:hypothetical protein